LAEVTTPHNPPPAALPAALEQAAAENVALRTATPPDLIDFMGVAFSDRQPDRRAAFTAQARAMAQVGQV
jgi:hypothetical protein